MEKIQQSKPKANTQRVLSLIVMLMALVVILSMPQLVKAANDDNAKGGGDSTAAKSNSNGASIRRQGYRIYLVDGQGRLQSSVVDIRTSDEIGYVDEYG